MLVRTHQDINARPLHYLENALFCAIAQGDRQIVATLIAHIEEKARTLPDHINNPSFSCIDSQGFGFLTYALDCHQPVIASDLLNYFLAHCTDPEWTKLHLNPIWIVTKDRSHTLTLAAKYGLDDLVILLMANASNVEYYFTDTKRVIAATTPFEINTESQQSTLMEIVSHCKTTTLEAALQDIAIFPLPSRIIDHVNNDGRSALHLAALNGNAEKAELLLRAGASTIISDKDKKLPLQCVPDDIKIAFDDYLIQSGVFINDQPPTSIDYKDEEQTKRIVTHGMIGLTSTSRQVNRKSLQQFYYPFTAKFRLKQNIIAQLETDADFMETVIRLIKEQKISFKIPDALQLELPIFIKKLMEYQFTVQNSQTEQTEKVINLEKSLASNCDDLQALIEQLDELNTVCADLFKKREEFMRSGEIACASTAIAILVAIQPMAANATYHFFANPRSATFGGIILYLLAFMTAIIAVIAILFIAVDLIAVLNFNLNLRNNNFPLATFMLKLFGAESRHDIPLYCYVEEYKQFQLLRADLHALLISYRATVQFDPHNANLIKLSNIIDYDLDKPAISLSDITAKLQDVITCLQQIENTTILQDKKPIDWQFFRKPTLKNTETEDSIELVRSNMQEVVVL